MNAAWTILLCYYQSGNCENFLSTTMVDKLKLPWLQKGNNVKIIRQCLVEFSIG